jgi:hypothetical protein
MVVVYNYRDRLGDFKLSTSENSAFEIDQIILNSLSLKSVSTQKTKSNPAGSFEFRLAPLKNWVTAITPGSWCVILMSNGILNDAAKYGSADDVSYQFQQEFDSNGDAIAPAKTAPTVDEKSFKMLGRIESVRAVANVNQTTGATETEYIVTGSDWGTVFNSIFYVDPISRTPGDQKAPIGMAERFGYIDYLRRAVGYDVSTLGKDANAGVNSGALKKAKNDASKGSVVNQVDFLKNGSTGAPVPPQPVAGDTEDQSTRQVTKDQQPKLPSALDNIGFILSLWGRADAPTSAINEKTGIVVKSQQVFRMPDELVRYMGFVDGSGSPSGVISQVLKQVGGKLTALDTYENEDNSAGIIDFGTILGEHTIWQVITNNSNELINELIPEIRFEKGKPALTLYTRVRPFGINPLDVLKKDTNAVGDNGNGGEGQKGLVDPYISPYKFVKKKRIASSSVIMCSYGTNWRDRVNFVEVNISRTIFQEAWAQEVKLQSQFIDEDSIGRDGLLPMIRGTTYVPAVKRAANPLGTSAYKYALKEWYFNTHKMFNGTLNLVGQDQYIQVGDNIMVESKVLNKNWNINTTLKTNTNKNKTFMMAHVESITHQTQVDGNGSRIFTTSINFVRGIITDVEGDIIVSGNHVGALDQDTSLVTPSVERNYETISTSGPMDPDRQQYPLKKGDKDFNEE